MPTFPTSAAMCSVEKTSDVSPLSFRISIRARGFDDVVTMPAASDRRTKKNVKTTREVRGVLEAATKRGFWGNCIDVCREA